MLHRITGRATKCGPSAISAIAGVPTHQAAAVIRRLFDRPSVNGVFIDELAAALEEFGWAPDYAIRHPKFRNRRFALREDVWAAHLRRDPPSTSARSRWARSSTPCPPGRGRFRPAITSWPMRTASSRILEPGFRASPARGSAPMPTATASPLRRVREAVRFVRVTGGDNPRTPRPQEGLTMPQVVEITVYTIDELSDAAKEAARAWYRESCLDYEWCDFVYEDFQTICGILGVTLSTSPVRPLWRRNAGQAAGLVHGLSARQGDGASPSPAHYSHANGAPPKAIRAHAPKDDELHRIADALQAVQKAQFLAPAPRVRIRQTRSVLPRVHHDASKWNATVRHGSRRRTMPRTPSPRPCAI